MNLPEVNPREKVVSKPQNELDMFFEKLTKDNKLTFAEQFLILSNRSRGISQKCISIERNKKK